MPADSDIEFTTAPPAIDPPTGGADGEPAEPSISSVLILELEERRAGLEPEEGTFFNREMTERELIEYLSFQAYYEKRAAEFIGRWLADTPEPEAFVMLAQ